MKLDQKIAKALQYLQDKHYLESATTYGEPGYQDPECGILFADWNNVPKGLQNWLESCGFELEWSDEWTQVNDKAYRTSPDSHGWECQLMLTTDGEYLSPDDDESEWVAECEVTSNGQPTRCLPSWITNEALEQVGFTLVPGDPEQAGFHSGMDSDPAKIASEHFKTGAAKVVFRKLENSQFYIEFETWVAKEAPDDQT